MLTYPGGFNIKKFNDLMICEYCKKEIVVLYGSGRFCSRKCITRFSAKSAKNGIKYNCNNCSRIFLRKTDLSKHINSKICLSKTFECKECKKIFTYFSRKKQKRIICIECHKKKWKEYVYKWTNEDKKNASIKRKLFLKNNPEKHPWKKNSKFISQPCEYLKKYLIEKNIKFESEYNIPEIKENFSIDIVFIDKKIALEINGNQHYENDKKTLKTYYQKRHNIIKNSGWKIYELHYKKAYNKCYIDKLLRNNALMV